MLSRIGAAESAAALAKARKKLLKIQGIASQADKAHSSVIVDVGVLAGDAAASDEEQAAADGRAQASASSSAAAGRSSEAAAQERRGSKQGATAGSATAGKSIAVSERKHLRICAHASKQHCASPCMPRGFMWAPQAGCTILLYSQRRCIDTLACSRCRSRLEY